MTSKQFKKTVKIVSKNLEKYTTAMESDIQVLINTILDLIESKILTLRRLFKLKLCINNVKSLSALSRMAMVNDDTSICITTTISDKPVKKTADSLDDLSSMAYEVDMHLAPEAKRENQESRGDKKSARLKCLEDIADIESLCSALNHPNGFLTRTNKLQPTDNQRLALDKYIYLLLDAERQKEKNKLSESANEADKKQIGDFVSSAASGAAKYTEISPERTSPSQESVVYLAKSEYESVLNILNMVLNSYKKQEDNFKTPNHKVEKTKTETAIYKYGHTQEDERKICSDSSKQRECGSAEKKNRNRKSGCV